MANQLPKSVLIKSLVTNADRYLGSTTRGFVNTNVPGVFSIQAKLEFQGAKTNRRFVHIMFTHTNKFWAPTDEGRRNWVVARSNQPEEDASKPSCTMSEPRRVSGGIWRFRHVHSGHDLCVVRGTTNAFVNPADVAVEEVSYQFSVVDRDTIVFLPKLVAFKGPNGKYLKGIVINNRNYLRFSSDDPTEAAVAQETAALESGYYLIISSFFDQLWRRDPTDSMILGQRVPGSAREKVLFWPVKVNKSSIALRNDANNKFCKRFTLNNRLQHLLNADDNTISALSVISVEELVLERQIINIRYRIADARIYNETVSVIGGGSADNNSDETNTLIVRVSYEDSSSFTFTNSLSIATSVETMFKAGIPLIGSTEITVGVEVTTSSEWGKTTSRTRKAEAEYQATVPPRSRVTIDFVATNGTCSVPFDYTQRDRLAKDGSFVETQHTDGIYRGANYYSFHFENEVIQRMLLPNEENPAAGLESLQI